MIEMTSWRSKIYNTCGNYDTLIVSLNVNNWSLLVTKSNGIFRFSITRILCSDFHALRFYCKIFTSIMITHMAKLPHKKIHFYYNFFFTDSANSLSEMSSTEISFVFIIKFNDVFISSTNF